MATLEDFFEGIALKDKVIGWGIIMIPMLILVLLAIFVLQPIPIPPNLVLGC